MDWHSTGTREELLIALSGQLHVETQNSSSQLQRRSLRAGYCLFLPRRTLHRVVNRSARLARYLYVTAPAE